MSAIAVPPRLGPELCRALGIDPDKVMAVHISVRSESISVTIERALWDDEAKEMLKLISHYQLEETLPATTEPLS